MTDRIRSHWHALLPVFAVWTVLVAITQVSVLESARPASAYVLVAIAGLTALKVALVIFSYMEVSRAPLWLKAACVAWITIALGTVTVLMVFPQWSVALVNQGVSPLLAAHDNTSAEDDK
ncbi:MAG TPA: cytochrome C oxidase subunit IV family protein [Solimonas sp.]|nr:cytochrome C oxidase subunit IV family protein [Solimonas sp.]